MPNVCGDGIACQKCDEECDSEVARVVNEIEYDDVEKEVQTCNCENIGGETHNRIDKDGNNGQSNY